MSQALLPFRPPRPNLVIEAGAGTGKTTEIVKEVISVLLDHPDLQPERLVMITFTEKAAAEIGERIRDAMTDLFTGFEQGRACWPSNAAVPIIEIPPAKFAKAKEACAKHLQQLDKIHSQTIHSFCQSVLRMFPFEAGLDANFELIEGYDRSRLLQEAWSRWVEHETVIHPTEESLEDWGKALEHFAGLDRVRETITTLLEKRILVTDESYSLGDFADAEESVRFAIAEAQRLPEDVIESCSDDNGRAVLRYLHDTVPPHSQDQTEWREYFSPIAVALEKINLTRSPKAARELLKILRNDTDSGPSVYEQLLRHEVSIALRRLACRFLTFLEVEKQKLGVVDFDDLLIRTARLLEDDSVAELVRRKFDYFFVDEFQDTDRVQARILDRLARNRAGDFVHGRLVLVGDPKQSIYAFRHADPEIYRDFIASLTSAGANKRTLTRQYRSDPALVDSLNTMFATLFPMDHDPNVYRPNYTELQAAKSPAGGTTPRMIFLRAEATQEDDEVAAAGHEGRAIAAYVAAAVRAGRAYRDFAILLRKMTNVQAFLDGLDRAGIPYVLPPVGALLETRPVVDLLTVLRAIAAPFDLGACVSAARTPYFAIDDNEIVGGVLEDSSPLWRELRERLRDYRQFAEQSTVAGLIDRLVEDAEIETVYGISRGGTEWLRFLDRIREMADHFDRTAGGSVGQFVDELLRRRDGAEEAQPMPLDDGRDAVRVMTVHGAKGLEFPIVILPELSARMKEDNLSVFTVENPRRLVFTGTVSTLSARYQGLAEIAGKRRDAETDRLFYVAVTRAAERVVFVSSPGCWKNHAFWKRIAGLFGWTKDTNHWPEQAEMAIREYQIGERTVPIAFVTPEIQTLGEEPSRFVDAALDVLAISAPRSADEPQHPAPPAPSRAELLRRAAAGKNRTAGILLHRVLEVWDGTPSALEPLLVELSREIGADLRALEVTRRRFDTVRRSEAFRRILEGTTHGRELTIYYLDESGSAVEGRIDRLIEEDGAMVVVDFKSGEAYAARRDSDRDQVLRYCDAISRMSGKPCRGLLWYIDVDTDSLVEVDQR